MLTDIGEVKRALADRALQVCEYLLPGGKAHGGEYEAGDVSGGPGRSLKVRVQGDKAGVWSDFAAGQSGDMIDLWAASRGVKVVDAIKEACAWMGQEFQFHNQQARKSFRRPDPVGVPLTPGDRALDYLKGPRGLSRDVLARYLIRTNEQGDVIFPTVRDGVLIQQKFMALERDAAGKKVIRVEKDCEPALFGWQALEADAREVTICEGEIDAMSLWMLGHPALSVPFGGGGGAKQQWIEHEWDRLAQFETIFVCMDMDEAGELAAKEISDRLGRHRCRIVRLPLKDANDCLLAGLDVDDDFEGSQSLDPDELKSASAYASKVAAIFSGEDNDLSGYPIPWAKAHGTVRFRPGELTIWSGINGHGKSLMLGQVVMHGAKVRGIRACIASMEMPPERTVYRLTRQAAATMDPSREYQAAISAWFGEWLWLFALVGTAKVARMLEVFEYAYRRYAVTTFVVDSLAKCGIDEDDYVGQKRLVEALCDFAYKFNVHVHLVSHIRKQADESRDTGKMDVKGTGAITDMAFNNLVVWRNKADADKRKPGDPDGLLKCDKQRNGTSWEGRIRLWYHPDSMQYVEDEGGAPLRYVPFSAADA